MSADNDLLNNASVPGHAERAPLSGKEPPVSGQFGRVKLYEEIMDEVLRRLDAGQLDEETGSLIGRLEAYYTGADWKRDYADDEAGLLPEDLKRGVLSQDGIYDLLERYREMSCENSQSDV